MNLAFLEYEILFLGGVWGNLGHFQTSRKENRGGEEIIMEENGRKVKGVRGRGNAL